MVEFVSSVETGKLALLIPLVAIVMGMLTGMVSSVAYQWRRARQTELEVSLKSELVERGFTATEVAEIINAGQTAEAKSSGRHRSRDKNCQWHKAAQC